MTKKIYQNKVEGMLFGLAIGDALGVPVEFKGREALRLTPVTGFIGYKCWNQPPGTWSDDSSLTFCLVRSLLEGYDLGDMGERFVLWATEGYWGAHGECFDIGGTTRTALGRLKMGEDPKFSGEIDEYSNGNGSLMRIAPMAVFLMNESDVHQRYLKVKEVSSITHAHFRSVFACFIQVEFLVELFKGKNLIDALESMRKTVLNYAAQQAFGNSELDLFDMVLKTDLTQVKEDDIISDGYVLSSLKSSFWCLFNSSTYEETVLKAVNLGGDTDTTGCIVGALAGAFYGVDAIRPYWIQEVARSGDISYLAGEFLDKYDLSL